MREVISMTKNEAFNILFRCGVLDEDGNVKDAYKDIIVKNEDTDSASEQGE